MRTALYLVRIACSAALLAGVCACSKSSETTATTTQAAPSTATAAADATTATLSPAVAAQLAAAQKHDDPCAFVTQAEMRTILHAPVVARVTGGNKCVYELPSGPGPYSMIEVDRGDGRIAMKAAGGMARAEPGIDNPLKGVGDQAIQVGPAIQVRSGEDLVQIVMSGVATPIQKAKTIFKTMKPRL